MVENWSIWEAGGVEIIEQHQYEDVRRMGFICGSRCPGGASRTTGVFRLP
jgi:hypothetical protein